MPELCWLWLNYAVGGRLVCAQGWRCRKCSDCTQLSFLGKFTALGIAVVVTPAKSSVADAAIAVWHTRLLHPSLPVEAAVVVPDAAARHDVAARTVGLVVVTAASMHSLTGELVSLWRLAATGVHGV